MYISVHLSIIMQTIEDFGSDGVDDSTPVRLYMVYIPTISLFN